MSIYAIADLHLGFSEEKPMDVFGRQWKNHEEKIKKSWECKIGPEDTVLIAGDVSWAMRLESAKNDLDFIHALPGRKIIVQGNHDYWWSSTEKLNRMYEGMFFIKNNYADCGGLAICGARGWWCPGDARYTAHDAKIYKREAGRLAYSLEQAAKSGAAEIWVMLHYPPAPSADAPQSAFLDCMADYPVTHVIYGHLHGREAQRATLTGRIDGVDYHLTSADYLDFCPVKIR